MKYLAGEEILARHPNTDKYEKGKILSSRGDRYKVQFDTGSEFSVHFYDIKATRSSRSTSRSRTRGGKSPARGSNRTKSPRRRSSGRSPTSANKKLTTRSTKLAKVSLPRIDIPTDTYRDVNALSTKSTNDDDNITELVPLQIRLKEIGTVTRRSTRLFSGTLKPESEHKMVMLTRNINRAVSLPLEKKTQLPDFNLDTKERGHSVQRDQDLLKPLNYEKGPELKTADIVEKREKEISMVSEPQEWGGWFGALVLIFLSPLLIIVPQLMCTQSRCKFGYPEIPKDLNSYINLEAFGTYLGFFVFVMIVSSIPVGRKIDGQQSRIERLQYRINGLFCAILSLLVFAAFVYNGYDVTDFIIANYVQFSISGWIIGTVLSLLLYVKGDKAPVANLNIHGSTNSKIYNFWQGREINPRIGSVDIKINIFRTAMIAMIIINMTFAIKAVEEAESYTVEHLNVATLLTTLLQIIYSTDALFFESTILTSFEIMYEGTGYMLCIGYMLYPFLPTLASKYVLYHKTQFDYLFAAPVLCFVLGYLLYRISNSQKDEFRRNPLSPALAHLETIPTIRGKKLIVSGLWGYIRHPNYLGDLIIWWSISCISLARDILPYYYAILCTGLLIHRAIRDNERCKARYGLAWEQYCSRVKYIILYRIF